MTKKKLVVLTSGNGSNLQAIIDQIELGGINATIEAVISNEQSYSLLRAKNHNIDAIYLSHKIYETREAYDQALLEAITPYNPDWIILAGFMRILTPSFINTFPNQIINIHPSLLPKYKGLDTHKKALLNGDLEHGCSIHYVTEELDAGEIIAQSKLTIHPTDTEASLAKRVQSLEHKLYPMVIGDLCEHLSQN